MGGAAILGTSVTGKTSCRLGLVGTAPVGLSGVVGGSPGGRPWGAREAPFGLGDSDCPGEGGFLQFECQFTSTYLVTLFMEQHNVIQHALKVVKTNSYCLVTDLNSYCLVTKERRTLQCLCHPDMVDKNRNCHHPQVAGSTYRLRNSFCSRCLQ
jgi:hypothetical protein